MSLLRADLYRQATFPGRVQLLAYFNEIKTLLAEHKGIFAYMAGFDNLLNDIAVIKKGSQNALHRMQSISIAVAIHCSG